MAHGEGGKATLFDLGSKNGTFHRGQRVTSPRELANGDEIRIGTVGMIFRSFSPPRSTQTAQAPPVG